MKKNRLNTLPPALPLSFLLAFFLVFTSCNDLDRSDVNYAYLGGEIINPTSEYLVIKKNGKVLDTAYLDDRNRFSLKIDSVGSGLYVIEHRPEFQNVYLEAGDSLLLRANTLAFDESLHFSGTGDTRNNFMAEMFLLDENNSDLLVSYYKTDPARFIEKTDSIRAERLSSLERIHEKHKFSESFLDLARKTIDYESYDLKERYTYLVNKYYDEYAAQISSNFHDYRKDVRFNEKTLQCSPAYKRFIGNYLINRSFLWCEKQNMVEEDCFDLSNQENIKARIKMAGNLLNVPSLREHFLTKLGSLGIILAESREDILDIIALLEKKGLSENAIQDMKKLGTIQLAFLPGTTLSDVPMITLTGDQKPIGKIISRPAIIFLWSIYSHDHQEEHKMMEELREKYPEIDFIGINLDVGETSNWRMAVQKYGYDRNNEFQLASSSVENRFLQFYLNKLLFLDSSGEVVIGDTFQNSPEFESRILEFLNR